MVENERNETTVAYCSIWITVTKEEITRLGLALIGKAAYFHDTRDAEIRDILELYNEGEYFFLRMTVGDPLKSKKAVKFFKCIQCFQRSMAFE